MAEPKPFTPVKLVCGVISGEERLYHAVKARLVDVHGPADLESPAFAFDSTDYYAGEMGADLTRRFMSFECLVEPEMLPEIKLGTNALELRMAKEEGRAGRRPVNIDPGYLTAASLVMATTKEFSHRIPLASGIYAHLELLFTKTDVRLLEWTYPDMRQEGCRKFFLEVRRAYLKQLKAPAA